jgi:hypothetical protein
MRDGDLRWFVEKFESGIEGNFRCKNGSSLLLSTAVNSRKSGLNLKNGALFGTVDAKVGIGRRSDIYRPKQMFKRKSGGGGAADQTRP